MRIFQEKKEFLLSLFFFSLIFSCNFEDPIGSKSDSVKSQKELISQSELTSPLDLKSQPEPGERKLQERFGNGELVSLVACIREDFLKTPKEDDNDRRIHKINFSRLFKSKVSKDGDLTISVIFEKKTGEVLFKNQENPERILKNADELLKYFLEKADKHLGNKNILRLIKYPFYQKNIKYPYISLNHEQRQEAKDLLGMK